MQTNHVGRPVTVPAVNQMTKRELKARVLGQPLSTVNQRYHFSGKTAPIVERHGRGFQVVGIGTQRNAGFDSKLGAIVR